MEIGREGEQGVCVEGWKDGGMEGEREEGKEGCSNSLHYGGRLSHLVYIEP